ncbi:MAG: hypothetical protein JWO13_2406 [Acidobacteriales bacterium]|nr:hypothetical protein [Terriglobales bacterium]
MSKTLAVFLIIAFSTPAAAQGSASVKLDGSIAVAATISAGQAVTSDDKIKVSVHTLGNGDIELNITWPEKIRKGRISIPLQLRTNMVQFKLTARATEGLSEMHAEIGVTQASGSGALVIPGAVESFVGLNSKLSNANVLATGARISRRGNDLCPDNALDTEIVLSSSSLGQVCVSTCSIVLSLK